MPDTDPWEVREFQSGTVIVTREHAAHQSRPWFYVHGSRAVDQNDRREHAAQLCDFANGGPRPEWTVNAYRETETKVLLLNGMAITATGPMVDKNPPALDWVQDESPEQADARARMIDWLMGVGARKERP